ncbi:MAG TPA: HAMP domain-containing sensor histidine kinase [Longimicrobiales bacterium]|nr:HAMP domain-containing sensor histidine kinase [Longimicrobiales bacterium]
MSHLVESSAQNRGRREAEADEVVEAWLASLPRPARARTRSPEVLESYRALGRSIVREGLDPLGAAAREQDVVDRELWSVAAASRRAGIEISQTLEDLARLEVALVGSVRARAEATRAWEEAFEQGTRVMFALDRMTRQLVHILEESALRSRREHLAALGAMTDVLSHELGNRLGAALTASEMLLSPDVRLDERALARAAELVRASVDAALHTVGDVRALAATRSRLEEPEVRSMPLPSLVRAVLDRLRPDAEEAGVELRVEGEIEPCRVDAARLRLIVFNLVGNGIKYRDPAKPRGTVRVSTERSDGRVALRVTDNGIGIPAEDLADVFRYRRRGSETDHVPGSGLGLAIVREAIEQIGGEIRVESEPGSGTTFTAIFDPLEEPLEEPVQAPVGGPAGPATA